MLGTNKDTPELEYRGVVIQRWDEMLSLTDMWRAAGKDRDRRPAQCLRSADAQKSIDVLSEVLTVGNSHSLVATVEGRNGHPRPLAATPWSGNEWNRAIVLPLMVLGSRFHSPR
jgi:hypothetical protein